MWDLLSGAYPWIKALHVMSVIAWMAGLFYLPRLYVYHAERAAPGSELSETLKIMEVKLYRFIMNPSMIASYVFGILLLLTPGVVDWGSDLWVWVKLAAIAVMTWLHHMLGLWRKAFQRDANVQSGRYFRLMNEVPTLAMVVIVVMVIVKPF